MTTPILITLFLLLIVHLSLGFINYSKFLVVLEAFTSKYTHYQTLEKQTATVPLQTDAFLKRMQMEKDYENLFIFMLTEKEGPAPFRRKTLAFLLVLGPIYNLM